MSSSEKINAIRDLMPVTQHAAYLNTGSVGAMSTITVEALHAANQRELLEGRATNASLSASRLAAAEVRQRFANMVQASPDTIALTHHTTDGMNIALCGLQWQPGDEIVTTDLEHPGGLLPVYVQKRFGVTVKIVSLPAELSPEDIVARFEAAITPRTRLLAFSHVAWSTGVCLPLAEIVAMAHGQHVLCAVDAAQAAGAIALDLPASGVDFYAMPGQKWLCGPEGTGALYVRPDRVSLLTPTFVGFRSLGEDGDYNFSGDWLPASTARRYEVGTMYRPGLQAIATNMAWLEETVGRDWIYSRIIELAAYARNALAQVAGIRVITPPGPHAGLVTFTLDGYEPPRVNAKLAEDNIVIRYLTSPAAVRVSTHFYNTEADIDRLVTALKAILASDPESLPAYP